METPDAIKSNIEGVVDHREDLADPGVVDAG